MHATTPVRARVNVASKYVTRSRQMDHTPSGTAEEIAAADRQLLDEYCELRRDANSKLESED